IKSHLHTFIRIFPFFTIYKFNIEFLISVMGEEVYLRAPFFFNKNRLTNLYKRYYKL
ncbi:hypothetical protein QR685DRAFT_435802, partial [Neurospora intermedia]